MLTAQPANEGSRVVYSYDVFWGLSDTTWSTRWDAYLKMPGAGRVHWFSILNSLLVVVVMAAIVAMIMARTVRRDLARYEAALDGGSAPGKADADESGWKMVAGDVFRAPPAALALAVHVGSGVQIAASGAVTLAFAALGFLSPAARGSLITAALALYLAMGAAAGYAATWLWAASTRARDGWPRVCWRVACFFPGVSALCLCGLNVLLAAYGSSGALPIGFFFSLALVWVVISIPLAYVGGALAARREPAPQPTREFSCFLELPVEAENSQTTNQPTNQPTNHSPTTTEMKIAGTNQIPRHVPPPHWASRPEVLFLAAGLLPFGTIFVELYFLMTSLWQGALSLSVFALFAEAAASAETSLKTSASYLALTQPSKLT